MRLKSNLNCVVTMKDETFDFDMDDLLSEFETVKAQSKAATSPYKYVCDWFINQFPNYRTTLKSDKALNRAA